MALDLHAGQIQGFFNIPVDNLFGTPVLLPYIRDKVAGGKVAIVSPDAGGVERARAFAKRLDASLAIIDKRRPSPNEVAEMRIIGDVEGTTAVIVDDMVDTAGTIVTAADALREAGARRVLAACTHAVLSGPAIERLARSGLEEMVVTDTIPEKAAARQSGKVKVLTVAHLIAEAIRRTHDEESISSLFD
ncbi:MAG: ribose-phosphate diphosphokinase [Candidatus Binatia bacterium]